MKRCLIILMCIVFAVSVTTVLSSCKNNSDDASVADGATTDEQMVLPWEKGGKQPAQYTYEEFEALSPVLQEAFVESFESADDFREWEKNSGYVDPDASVKTELPWEKGGKKPEDYTIEEFNDLSGPQQEAFVESFGSADAFEKWEADASLK